jgi:hypothetical protein
MDYKSLSIFAGQSMKSYPSCVIAKFSFLDSAFSSVYDAQ